MGKFAGERIVGSLDQSMGEAPGDAGERTFSTFSRYLEAKGKDNLGQIRAEMRNLMTEKVGVFRVEKGILEAIEALKELKERACRTALSCEDLIMNPDLIQRWEVDNLLDNAMVIATSALNRRESRGGHFRDDFPERKDDFHFHTLAYMTNYGEVRIGRRAVDMSLFKAGGQHHERFGIIDRKY
jgi:succinate dehydrogenase/fumarate reductase flavoprotein subunit